MAHSSPPVTQPDPPFHGFGPSCCIPGRLQVRENEGGEIKVKRAPTVARESSIPFYDFGPSSTIQGRFEVRGDQEATIEVVQRKRRGKPRGLKLKNIMLTELHRDTDLQDLNLEGRRPPVNSSLIRASSSPSSPAVSQSPTTQAANLSVPETSVIQSNPKFGQGTGSRIKLYLLDVAPTDKIGAAKIPKTRAVMSCFFYFLIQDTNCQQNANPKTQATKETANKAASLTVTGLKDVWRHHFGPRLIDGQEWEGAEVNKDNIMIIRDIKIIEKILFLWKQWKLLEVESCRPSRSETTNFKMKESRFRDKLDQPFDITLVPAEDIIKNAGIKDYKEEQTYLKLQLDPQQIGSCGSVNFNQRRRDLRIQKEKNSLEQSRKKEKVNMMELQTRQAEVGRSTEYDNENKKQKKDANDNDEDFNGPVEKSVKIDVMGPISLTADALGLSVRARTALAASVTNSLGINVQDTNINRHSAWTKAKAKRSMLDKKVKGDFEVPARVSVHWDGKTLNIKGNLKSSRVCVYISGTDAERLRKLLAIPETDSGTGKAEAEVVKQVCVEWKIKEEIVNLVFDTTASNSSGEVGACMFLELWIKSPILWSACRHHIYELHIKHAVEVIAGATKEPGVVIFKRLKDQWYSLEIDLANLELFDFESVPEWFAEEGKKVLSWSEKALQSNTWPRCDYRELMELVIVFLGGTVPNFQFKLPGADHHARWMSKAIYYLKIWLLSRTFKLSKEEKVMIERCAKFTGVLYAKAWFLAPLSTSAARNDLVFHLNILRYREMEPKVAFGVIQSIRRHMWYLAPQMVVLALVDPELEDEEKEEMGRTLHGIERESIATGRPQFPVLNWMGEVLTRPRLPALISSESWLIFNILKLNEPQDWLLTPCSYWPLFADYQKLAEFANNMAVVNDLAERGISLMTKFINSVQSEEERQELLQSVEYWRSRVPDLNKSSLAKC